MLSEKQLTFLENYSERLESLPRLRSFYDRALDMGLTRREAIELMVYYAEASKIYKLRLSKKFDPFNSSVVVKVFVESKTDPRDSLGLTNFAIRGGEERSVDESLVMAYLRELLKVSYDIDLDKLKSLKEA